MHSSRRSGKAVPNSLRVQAAVHRNPYRYMLDDAELTAMLASVGSRRAESILRNCATASGDAPRGPYPRLAMGFIILDPTADPYVSHADAVLGAVAIGDEARSFLPKAAAKAAAHRRLGHANGVAVHADPHLLGNGSFRYGHSTEIRGLIVAASSQTPDQDLFEASRLASDLIEELTNRHHDYEWRCGETDWLSPDSTVPAEYTKMVAWFPDNTACP